MGLLVYLGVALLLAGASTTIVGSLESSVNVFSLIFGIIMASMGLVLSFAALKAKDRGDKAEPACPLSYAESELKSYYEMAKKTKGNRALGFVLVSMTLFIFTVSGVFGFFVVFWQLTLLGACLVVGGVILLWVKQ